MNPLAQVLEIIIIPLFALVIMTVIDQRIEELPHDVRIIKAMWDIHIFSLGIQMGLFVTAIFHLKILTPPESLGLAFILILTGMIGRIRKNKLYKGVDIIHNLHQNFALWSSAASVVTPVLYMIN